jgi:OHCU decarboxylase
MTIEQLNAMSAKEFSDTLGGVYEHSRWVAERVWKNRPFKSPEDLAGKMSTAVDAASQDEQMALLRAHPELGTRLRVGTTSAAEQAEAGLHRLTEGEYDTLLEMNNAYSAKFGFPFIYAVRGSGTQDILIALGLRLDEDAETEFRQALWEVSRIARFRLEGMVRG